MYKALVRSHLDYRDTIYTYHIYVYVPVSNSQINLSVTLNSLMEKVEKTQYQAALAITGTMCQYHVMAGYKSLQTLRRIGMGDTF